MATAATREAGKCRAYSHQPCAQLKSRDSDNMREKGWMGIGRTPGRTCHHHLKREFFLLLSSPPLALTTHSTSQTEARSQCSAFQLRADPFAKPSRDHMVWHKILGATCPLPPGSSGMGWISHCRGFGDCPWQTAVCSAVHSSDASHKWKQTRSCFGQRVPRDGTVACLFPNLPEAIIQKVDTKEKGNQERKHWIQETS